MRDLHLTLFPSLYLASLALFAGCHAQDAEGRLIAADISVSAILEQPGNEDEQVVHVTFHRGGQLAKRSLNVAVVLMPEVQAPVERVSLGELVPEDERDAFTPADFGEFGLSGRVTLAPCPGGVACTSVFSCVVTSSSPAPGEISLHLLGGFTVHEDHGGPFAVELQVAP